MQRQRQSTQLRNLFRNKTFLHMPSVYDPLGAADVGADFGLLFPRSPSEAELSVMQSILREQKELYRDKVDQAKQLLSNGDRNWNSELDACELAAWTMLSSMILNLDETVTKS